MPSNGPTPDWLDDLLENVEGFFESDPPEVVDGKVAPREDGWEVELYPAAIEKDGNVVYPDGGLDLGLVLPLFESTSMAFWQEEGVTIDGVYDDHGEKHKVRLTLRARAPEGTPPLTRVKPDGSFTEPEPLAAKN